MLILYGVIISVTQSKHCINFLNGCIKSLFKSHIFCAFLILFCSPTHAQFINTLTDGKQKVWVDPSSKEGTGNIRRIMELVNYKDKQIPKQGLEYSSIIYQYQFDCNKKVFKVLMSVAYEKHQGQGRVIFRDDTATPTYVSIRDGSSVFEAHAIACK
jgi:hypothetical protein